MQTVTDLIGEGGGESFEGEWIKLTDIQDTQVAILGFNGPHKSSNPQYDDYYVVGIERENGDEEIFSTSSKPLMDRLTKLQDAQAFPCLGTFKKVPSRKAGGNDYWTVG